MQDLSFLDETFSHSITNFAIFSLPDPEAAQAASHIHRTLQKDGTAVLTVWAESPTSETLQATHHATRSRTDSLPMFTRLYWKKASHVRKVLIDAGISEDKVDILKQEVYLILRTWRDGRELLGPWRGGRRRDGRRLRQAAGRCPAE